MAMARGVVCVRRSRGVGRQPFGKGKGLERGGRRVARAVFQAGAEPQRPCLVKAAMQDAEGRIVVTGDDDQLMVGANAGVAPDEQAVFWRPSGWRCSRMASQGDATFPVGVVRVATRDPFSPYPDFSDA